MPQYKEDQRLKKMKEYRIPPEGLFVGLGWDEELLDTEREFCQRRAGFMESRTEEP